MQRESRQLDDHERERERAPAPAPVQPADQLAWASAVGNQAVQRLARSVAPAEEEQEEAEQAPAEEGEPEMVAIDELPEDELPQ